jgi:hypothetical protein
MEHVAKNIHQVDNTLFGELIYEEQHLIKQEAFIGQQ